MKYFLRMPDFIGMVILGVCCILALTIINALTFKFALILITDVSPNNVLIGKNLLLFAIPSMLIVIILIFMDIRRWIYKTR